MGVRVEGPARQLVEEIASREGRSVGEILGETLADWLTRRSSSLPLEEDHSLTDLMGLLNTAKAQGKSWAELSPEVEHRFGAKLEKDQLKAFLR